MMQSIEHDQKLPLIWKLLASIMSEKDIKASYALIIENNLFIVCRNSVIFEFNNILTELNQLDNGSNFLAIDLINSYQFKDIDDSYYVLDYYNTENIKKYYLNYHNLDNNYNHLMSETNLEANQIFEDLLSLKTSDGAKFYKNIEEKDKEFMIPVFNGFPKLVKGDKVCQIDVYDSNGYNQIINLLIYKKKINKYINIKYQVINLFYNGG